MIGKKALTILLTVLLFLSAVALGVSTVFRVDKVTVLADVTSSAVAQAEELKEDLEKAYERDSTFSVNDEKARKVLEKYTYLRLTGFKKSYPNKIVVSVTELLETYAVETPANGYLVYTTGGELVARRDNPQNRFDGESNVLVKGFTDGEGKIDESVFALLFRIGDAMDGALGTLRANVLSIERIPSPSVAIRVTMREGVKLYLFNAQTKPAEKATAAVAKYRTLTDKERLTGRISVQGEEEIMAGYSAVDEFAPKL